MYENKNNVCFVLSRSLTKKAAISPINTAWSQKKWDPKIYIDSTTRPGSTTKNL
ncbi:hypothetical protein JCM39068_38960 [Desulfocastanea catecholica]